MPAVTMFDGRKPGSSAASRATLLTSNPAPESSMTASAISAATSSWCARRPRPPAAAPALLEHPLQVDARQHERRQQAEDDSGGQHEREGEDEARARRA